MKTEIENKIQDILIRKPVDSLNNISFLDHIMLNKAIEQLPTSYRTIVILHDVVGLTHTEIARWLGCSEEVSKSKLHNGRMKLRKLLRG